MSVGTCWRFSGKVRQIGGNVCRGNVKKQAEQWEVTAESWRTAARGRRGGVRSSPIPIFSIALISILKLQIVLTRSNWPRLVAKLSRVIHMLSGVIHKGLFGSKSKIS